MSSFTTFINLLPGLPLFPISSYRTLLCPDSCHAHIIHAQKKSKSPALRRCCFLTYSALYYHVLFLRSVLILLGPVHVYPAHSARLPPASLASCIPFNAAISIPYAFTDLLHYILPFGQADNFFSRSIPDIFLHIFQHSALNSPSTIRSTLVLCFYCYPHCYAMDVCECFVIFIIIIIMLKNK